MYTILYIEINKFILIYRNSACVNLQCVNTLQSTTKGTPSAKGNDKIEKKNQTIRA